MFRTDLRYRLGMLFFLLLASSLSADAPPQNPVPSPIELVKNAVFNEVHAAEQQHIFWTYRLSKETKSGKQSKQMIETHDGTVARLISLNDRELSPAERISDDQRLSKLAGSREEQLRILQDQKVELQRFLDLVRALPEALLYEYGSTESMNGRATVRLRFRPNPRFHLTTRETLIYRTTQGELLIDLADQRILRLDATLTDEVNVGWGLLGHINKGGKLLLEQQRLAQGQWRINRLNIEATGQAFVFKSITLRQNQFASDFQPVPENLTIPIAVQILKKTQLAEAGRP